MSIVKALRSLTSLTLTQNFLNLSIQGASLEVTTIQKLQDSREASSLGNAGLNSQTLESNFSVSNTAVKELKLLRVILSVPLAVAIHMPL